jgi:hypothetical protein
MSLRDLIASDVTNVFFNTEEFAELVTYAQGAEEHPATPAIPSGSVSNVDETEGFATANREVTWHIPVAALSVTPREGDRILRPFLGRTFEYEVMPSESNLHAVEQMVDGSVWQIQTKLVNEIE